MLDGVDGRKRAKRAITPPLSSQYMKVAACVVLLYALQRERLVAVVSRLAECTLTKPVHVHAQC